MTGTEISRGRAGTAGALVAVALAGATACGGSSQKPFAWLTPRPAPGSWQVIRIPTGSELAYPPGWRTQPGDVGTATAALIGAGGRYLGYLNVTPRQGNETLSGWASFRASHNREEGDRDLTQLGSATGLAFLGGRGTCVKDSYTTRVGTRYIEIACIVEGARATSVIVAAAPPSSWARVSPLLERAIEGFRV